MPGLPALPQMRLLPEIVNKLWTCPEVQAIWLGGSFTTGKADAYSDVDLRAAVDKECIDEWRQRDLRPFFGDEYLDGQAHDFTGNGVLRHFLGASGYVWDLWIVDVDKELPRDEVVVLACRNDALRERLDVVRPVSVVDPSPADPDIIRALIVDYWICTSKDVKVAHRNNGIILKAGLDYQSSFLLRLWHVLATGKDPGQQRVTIHVLGQMLPPIVGLLGPSALEMIGAPARTMEEIAVAVERNRDEVARVGRLLADRVGFEYPERVEVAARRLWDEAMSR